MCIYLFGAPAQLSQTISAWSARSCNALIVLLGFGSIDGPLQILSFAGGVVDGRYSWSQTREAVESWASIPVSPKDS